MDYHMISLDPVPHQSVLYRYTVEPLDLSVALSACHCFRKVLRIFLIRMYKPTKVPVQQQNYRNMSLMKCE